MFGVEVSRNREILCLTPVTEVPQTPDYLLGLINLRGQVVPVVNMRLMFGLPAGEETEDTCIIRVSKSEEMMLVQGMSDVTFETESEAITA